MDGLNASHRFPMLVSFHVVISVRGIKKEHMQDPVLKLICDTVFLFDER